MYFTAWVKVRYPDKKEETLKYFAAFKSITSLDDTTFGVVNNKVKEQLEQRLKVEVLEIKTEANLNEEE